MTRMLEYMARMLRDETGATAIEYSLMAAVIGAGLVLILAAFEDSLYELYINGLKATLDEAAAG